MATNTVSTLKLMSACACNSSRIEVVGSNDPDGRGIVTVPNELFQYSTRVNNVINRCETEEDLLPRLVGANRPVATEILRRKNCQGKTDLDQALLRAVEGGNYQAAHVILSKYRSHLSLNEYGAYLPIHAACARGDLEMVKLLVRYGADVRVPTGLSNPLTIAEESGNNDLVNFLEEKLSHLPPLDHYSTPPDMRKAAVGIMALTCLASAALLGISYII